MTERRRLLVWAGLAAALVAAAAASLAIGPVDIGWAETVLALAGKAEPEVTAIIREIRLPRTLLGVIVGGVLGLSGAALQGLFRNPLAEPGIVGVTASAGAGAVFALQFGLATASSFALPFYALGGALAAMLVLGAVAMRDASVLTLILLGVAINSFAGAMTALMLNLSDNPFALNAAVLWLLGSIANRGMDDVILVLPFVVVGLSMVAFSARGLQALSLGEDVARSLGLPMRAVRGMVIIGSALAVGACVAVSGTVGFVGLVVPHLLRPFLGHEPGRLLWPSAVGGAALVLAADSVIRLVPTGQELKLGVATAIIGAPFFFYLVIATRRRMR